MICGACEWWLSQGTQSESRSTMASDYGQRYQSLQKFLHIDAMVTLHEQMLQAGKTHSADQLGDMLLKLGRGHYPWM